MGEPRNRNGSEPTLELPSLFGRKNRKGTDASEESEPAPSTEREPEPAPSAEPEPEPAVDQRDEEEPAERRTERAPERAPALPQPIAAAITGAATGLVGVALTYGGMRGCEATRGTSSCGGGPGFFILLAIVIVMVLVGAALLSALRVTEPRSTGLLGVGLVCVVALLVLPGVIFSAWMFLVLPLVGAASFALSAWVTTRYVDTTESGPDHDVR